MAKITDDSAMRRIYEMMKGIFRDRQEYTTQEVYQAMPEVKKSTLSWYLHMLVQKNYIKSVRHGVYGFYKQEDAINYEHMQDTSKVIYDLMRKTGLGFYLSGWDALAMEEKNPAAYPVILLVDRVSVYDVHELLAEKGFRVYHDSPQKVLLDEMPDEKKVLLMAGSNMDFGEYGVACVEKGFADLYYAVTRMGYPTPSEQLAELHLMLLKTGKISVAKLKDAGRELGVKTEFEFMLQMSLLPEGAANFFIYGLMSEKA